MEIQEIYLNSQAHKIISLDKSREMISHAYMLECADEILLNEYAFFLAKEIFCLSANTPCNECNNCMKVEHSNMVDLKIYPKDNKGLVVDDINEIVGEAYVKPLDSDYKVFILNHFDNATTQAQNKLLKTLEEPPRNVIFILTCSNSNAVLQTILSRVKVINEGLLDIDTAQKYLDGLKVADAISVAGVSGGNLSVAMKIATKGEAGKIIDLAFKTLIELRSSADVLKFSSSILSLKKDVPFFVDTLISILRDVAVCGNSNLINFKSKQRELLALKEFYALDAIRQITHELTEIHNKLNFNCNLTGIVDQMLLKILEVKFLCRK